MNQERTTIIETMRRLCKEIRAHRFNGDQNSANDKLMELHTWSKLAYKHRCVLESMEVLRSELYT